MQVENETIISRITPYATILSTNETKDYNFEIDPGSIVVSPIFQNIGLKRTKIAAILVSSLRWQLFLDLLIPNNANNVIVEVKNDCDQSYTYQ